MEGKPRKEHRATAIEKERSSPEKEGMYSVRRGGQALQRRFDSFHEAYMYGLNTFCSEDFLVWREVGSETKGIMPHNHTFFCNLPLKIKSMRIKGGYSFFFRDNPYLNNTVLQLNAKYA